MINGMGTAHYRVRGHSGKSIFRHVRPQSSLRWSLAASHRKERSAVRRNNPETWVSPSVFPQGPRWAAARGDPPAAQQGGRKATAANAHRRQTCSCPRLPERATVDVQRVILIPARADDRPRPEPYRPLTMAPTFPRSRISKRYIRLPLARTEFHRIGRLSCTARRYRCANSCACKHERDPEGQADAILLNWSADSGFMCF